MQLLTSTFTTLAVFASLAFSRASAAAALGVRQGVDGPIIAPPDGGIVVAGAPFTFTYEDVNYCHNGYSPISVYISANLPSSDDVGPDGTLSPGSFILQFGEWLIPNFEGLPPITPPGLPPVTLSLPILEGVANNTVLYFSVVETFLGCSPGGRTEYGLETTSVVYIEL